MRSFQMPRWFTERRNTLLRIGILLPVLGLVGASVFVVTSSQARASQSQILPQIISQQNFDAVGLPAGMAIGTAARGTLPPGLNFRHAHGGPEYVYVISGSFTVITDEGANTYNAGDFAAVP